MKKTTIYSILFTLLIPVHLTACPAQSNNQAVNIKFDKEFLDKLKDTGTGTKPVSGSALPWSVAEVETFKNQCTASSAQSSPGANPVAVATYCSCLQTKVQQKFRYNETANITVGEQQNYVQTCTKLALGGGSSGSAVTPWTPEVVQLFLSQCTQSAYNSFPNTDPGIINKYCSCTQSTLAARYSFEQLQNITAGELQNTALACKQQL